MVRFCPTETEVALVRIRNRKIASATCVIAVVLLALVVEPVFAVDLRESVVFQSETAEGALERFARGLGGWAFVFAPMLMMVVAILPIPAEIPAMLNGMLFGPVLGTFMSWSGAIVGAVISFELARRFGRPFAQRFINPETLSRADALVQSAGWPVLLVLRLIPSVAFTAINWTSGLTTLGRPTFLWTTAVGILPGAILFTVSGTGLAAIYRMNPLAGWALIVAGVLAIAWTVLRFRQALGRAPAVVIDG